MSSIFSSSWMKNGPWPAPSVLVTTLHASVFGVDEEESCTGTAVHGGELSVPVLAMPPAPAAPGAPPAGAPAAPGAPPAGEPAIPGAPAPGAPARLLPAPAAPGFPLPAAPPGVPPSVEPHAVTAASAPSPSSICRRLTAFASAVSTFDSRLLAILSDSFNARSLRLGNDSPLRARLYTRTRHCGCHSSDPPGNISKLGRSAAIRTRQAISRSATGHQRQSFLTRNGLIEDQLAWRSLPVGLRRSSR